ncbi:hypothetical protein [Planomonospora venezuelensis]|uniref:Uncharacterized protein n=1 Tax=Planomonospora venezuelensis TaxID=1999 RepID=A0A841D9T0_PLAVE|nr:hypothetical protein [Planomonospora venezuelensis]MBB5965234.1 hypothetical protein [Planomonospora venezuelensis]GIN00532.1 hypothetical protein Pve01_21900 [Planomonospora venezuelensis]
MKRVIKAAVAAAAFGLAAAICSPAQAEAAAADPFNEQAAAGTVSMALQGLSGGLFDGGAALSGLGNGQGAMAGDGVFGTGSESVRRILGISADQITWGSPIRGVADGMGPVGQTVDTTGGLLGNTSDAAASVGRLTEDLQGTGEAVEGVGNQGGAVDGLVYGLNEAVPQGPEQAGNLSPLVDAVAPEQGAPLRQVVGPVTRSASIDQLAPLLSGATGGGQGVQVSTGQGAPAPAQGGQAATGQATQAATGLVGSMTGLVGGAAKRATTR